MMTKNNQTNFFGVLVVAMLPMVGTFASETMPVHPTVQSVKAEMKRVADWQIEHLHDDYRRQNLKMNELNAWTYGALYVGMLQWAAIADNNSYYEWLKGIAVEQNWKLCPYRFFHADDHCVGQLYLGLYEKYGAPEMIGPTRAQFDKIMAAPSNVDLTYINEVSTDRWSWCDALFMAPPVWAKLSTATGDPKYRDFMFNEFKATTDFLFDQDEHLYFRDSNFFERRHNGKKIFWSRGNGWVFGGLALILPEIPKPSAQYDYYANIYKQMAEKLISIQTPEGYWSMSLLEADSYPTPETSGTGFYCFGLAWGINNGLLEHATYEPAVLKAWDALTRCITDDGMLSYVQPIGAGPGQAWADRTEVYGTGAFLAAGAEVCRLLEN